MSARKIYLSPPNVGEKEKTLLADTISEGWVAPIGPQLDQFEKELERNMEGKRALALNSGTAALHLALKLAGVEKGDHVLVGTFTFAACANVVSYQGAETIFIDSEKETWNLDPILLEEYLVSARIKPKAVIVTHLYGVPAQILRIRSICDMHGAVLIEDAAEAIGSKYSGNQVGTFGDFGVISFNGNKLITTGGGGALVVSEENYVKGLHLATQANCDPVGYDHDMVGYNYRLSNVLASVGLAQLEKLEYFVKRKREIYDYYRSHLPSAFVLEEPNDDSFCNRWLTTPLIAEDWKQKIDPLDLIRFLKAKNIESRPLWKPLHLQRAYRDFAFVGSSVAESIYENGLCLPSGSGLSDNDLEFIVSQINSYLSGFFS